MFERFGRDDRMLLAFAMQEASELGHRRLGNDHLILGMLCNARSPIFEVLGAQGLTLATARDAVRAHHDGLDADAEAAEEETAAQRYEQDRDALRSIGINLDKVREAVRERFGDDLSDGWAQRPERWRRGRADDDEFGDRRRHGPHGRPRGRGRGGFGPRGFGPGGPGFGPDGPGAGPGFGPCAGAAGGDGGIGPRGGDPWQGGPGRGPWEGGRGRRGPRGGGRPRFADEARGALGAAVHIAQDRDDDRLRPEYLLLGILEAGDAASRALIESATTVDDLKAAVVAILPDTSGAGATSA